MLEVCKHLYNKHIYYLNIPLLFLQALFVCARFWLPYQNRRRDRFIRRPDRDNICTCDQIRKGRVHYVALRPSSPAGRGLPY